MTRIQLGIALSAALLGAAACGGTDPGPLDRVDSIVFLQREARNEMGDIFQYTSYLPGGRLLTLSPPTADGKLEELCCSQKGAMFADIDIQNYDLSFDAQAKPPKGEIVFSGKLSAGEHYGLFILHLETGEVEQLATDPNQDYVSPIFLPGDKILFVTNKSVEEGAPQHRDEYERGETLQLGVMNRDGTDAHLGPRNLSHRVFPSLASDGRVMLTQPRFTASSRDGRAAPSSASSGFISSPKYASPRLVSTSSACSPGRSKMLGYKSAAIRYQSQTHRNTSVRWCSCRVNGFSSLPPWPLSSTSLRTPCMCSDSTRSLISASKVVGA